MEVPTGTVIVAGTNAKLSILTWTSPAGGADAASAAAVFTADAVPVGKVMPKICGPLAATTNAVSSAAVHKIQNVSLINVFLSNHSRFFPANSKLTNSRLLFITAPRAGLDDLLSLT